MVGTVQMRALTRIAAQTDVARLALIGDRRQLRAVEAGQPFGLLQDAGMPTAKDGRSGAPARRGPAGKRCCTWWRTSRAWRWRSSATASWRWRATKLGRKAAQLWLDLDPDLRAGTAILAPTHELGPRSMTAVRQGLEDEGVLHGPELEIERYVNLHLTRSQKGDVANYRPGDVAVFHHDVYGVKSQGRRCLPRAGDGGRGACCWRIPTAGSGGSTRPATSATGSTSTRPRRWSSKQATMHAGPATIRPAA